MRELLAPHMPGCLSEPPQLDTRCPYCAQARPDSTPAPELPAKYLTRSSDFPRRPKR